MRELKFRAWDKAKQRMFPVFDLIWSNGSGLLIGDEQSGRTLKYLYQNSDEVVLMQYTGLNDCQGKEIYVGDIITHPPHWRGGREITVVESIHEFCGDLGHYLEPIEIIGNLYETPQLAPKK
jgi:uncharacterized phage protein (TIGR01671 family)